jgi:hypothetical protein
MQAPRCSEHGRLVLDLALGNLGDSEAELAETVQETCATCNAWWSQHFESESAMVVDQAVREALTSFRAPSRRRHQLWWAAAAAAVLALAVTALWQPESGLPSVPGTPVAVGAQALRGAATPGPPKLEEGLISINDFELGSLSENQAAIVDQPGFRQSAEPIFNESFETGSFTGWTPET